MLKTSKRRGGLSLALGVAGALALAYLGFLLRSGLPAYEIVITNVTLLDGSKARPRRASIGLRGDRIAAIWHAPMGYRADRSIDGRGLFAAPGFIDTHSHADSSALSAQASINAWNYVTQGVTTLITGNCGRSAVDLEDLAGAIATHGANVNMASLVGHNTVKRRVMRDRANGPPTAGELAKMRDLVKRAMQAGAIGISTGLAYVPGRFSSKQEIRALLEEAGDLGGLHATHIRNEGADGFGALEEVIQVSRAAHIPLVVSHFKITGPKVCSDLSRRLRLIEEGRRDGFSIQYDFYPYTASSTNLEPLLPDWFSAAAGNDRRRILHADDSRLFKDVLSILSAEGWQDLSFARVALAHNRPDWNGRRIPQIAEAEFGGRHLDQQLKVMGKLLEAGDVQMTYHSLCRNVMKQIATDPRAMVGSDSAIRSLSDAYHPHPRGCGTYPRFLKKFVKDEGLLSWAEAVSRLTGLSAQSFHLKDRGFLREGYYADIVIFDPDKIRDRATYDHPLRTPEGIEYVFVNGEIVLERGQVTARMPGRFLRSR